MSKTLHTTPVALAIRMTGLTGEALAERMGISAAHVSRLKTSKTPTNTHQISQLADICGVSESEFYKLLAGDGSAPSAAAQAIAGVEPDAPINFETELFDPALKWTRLIDQEFARGHADSRNFRTLLHAIYNFIQAERERGGDQGLG